MVSGNANNNFNATPKFLFMQQNAVTNTYTGGTTINSGGRIKMGAASAVGATNVVGLGNLGATNNEMPFTPSGASGRRASTRCTIFAVKSCSPQVMNILVPWMR